MPDHRAVSPNGIRSYGGEKIKGRKRYALVDTDGRALKLHARAAGVQERNVAGPLAMGLSAGLAI